MIQKLVFDIFNLSNKRIYKPRSVHKNMSRDAVAQLVERPSKVLGLSATLLTWVRIKTCHRSDYAAA